MKISEALSRKLNGLYYGSRIILPFNAHFLKIIIDNDIIMDFSPLNNRIYIRENEDFTNIYFGGTVDISELISKYEAIKMVIVEKDKDIFNFVNHIKIALYLEEKHNVKIEPTDEDIIFIE